jgi:lipopolysaccharide transport system permease protein
MKIFDRKYINLVRELTLFNFKLRDQGTFLGFIWTLLHPFLMLTILFMLFSKRLGRGIEHYEIYLLIGIIQWNFLSAGTNEGLKSIINSRSVLRNVNISRIAVVLSSVLAVFISFLLELFVLGGFIVFSGLGFSPVIVLLPFVVLIQLLLVISISLVLSCLNVYFKDAGHIWNILLKIGFFTTPIFYSIPMFISKPKMVAYFLNPMTQLMIFARQIILFKNPPALINMLFVFVAVLIILALCYLIFKKLEDGIMERL